MWVFQNTLSDFADKRKECVDLLEHKEGLCREKERDVWVFQNTLPDFAEERKGVGIFQNTVKDFVERSEGMCVSNLSEHSEGFFFGEK